MLFRSKLVQLLAVQSGTGKNGQWKKQDIIVETEGTYPKKVCISVWGDKMDLSQWQPGNMLKIDFDVESREFNGRWYTDIKAWKIESAGTGSQSPIDNPATAIIDPLPMEDDLPF